MRNNDEYILTREFPGRGMDTIIRRRLDEVIQGNEQQRYAVEIVGSTNSAFGRLTLEECQLVYLKKELDKFKAACESKNKKS